MQSLDAKLNDVGWWFDHLAREYDQWQETSAVLRRTNMPGKVDDIILKSLSEAFSAYDERLATPGVAVIESPAQIQRHRTFLGAMKKFRSSDAVPNALATTAKLGFIARNAEVKGNIIPRRFQALMRSRIADALRFYRETSQQCLPHFGPGAVAEGLNHIDRWKGLRRRAFSSSFDPYQVCRTIGSDLFDDSGIDLPCKLVAVAKDWDKARLITVESLIRSFCQQWVRDSIVAALDLNPLTRFLAGLRGIDPQQRHRELALRGSLTGELATFDMKDASDWQSFGQVSSVFPALVMADLEFCRSTHFREEAKGRAGLLEGELYMYAGMGNATTFMVETLLFWAACHAIADYHRVGRRYVSVFGDDIIVDRRLADLIVQTNVFEDFGWRLNLQKSMWRSDVYFRESCGCHAFKGHDVTLTRIFGYRNTPKGVLGVAQLIQTLSKSAPWLAEQVWRQTTLPNVQGAPAGSASVDLCWCPRTDVPTRKSARYHRIEYKLEKFVPLQIHATPNTTELMFGALTKQLSTERRTRRGRVIDHVVATVQRRGRMESKWLAAT